MADREKTFDAMENPAIAAFSALASMQKAGVGPLPWMSPEVFEKMGNMGSEMARFVADRVKEDVRLQHQLLHCRDLAKMQEIQSEFLRDAIDAYVAETGRISALGSDLMNAALQRKTP